MPFSLQSEATPCKRKIVIVQLYYIFFFKFSIKIIYFFTFFPLNISLFKHTFALTNVLAQVQLIRIFNVMGKIVELIWVNYQNELGKQKRDKLWSY